MKNKKNEGQFAPEQQVVHANAAKHVVPRYLRGVERETEKVKKKEKTSRRKKRKKNIRQ